MASNLLLSPSLLTVCPEASDEDSQVKKKQAEEKKALEQEQAKKVRVLTANTTDARLEDLRSFIDSASTIDVFVRD